MDENNHSEGERGLQRSASDCLKSKVLLLMSLVLAVFSLLFVTSNTVSATHFSDVEKLRLAILYPSYSDQIEEESLMYGDPYFNQFENVGGRLGGEVMTLPQGLSGGMLLEGGRFINNALESDGVSENVGILKKLFSSTLFTFLVLVGFIFLSVLLYFIFLFLRKFGGKLFEGLVKNMEVQSIKSEYDFFEEKKFSGKQKLLLSFLFLSFLYLVYILYLGFSFSTGLSQLSDVGTSTLIMYAFIFLTGFMLLFVFINLAYLFLKKSESFSENCKFFFYAFIFTQSLPVTVNLLMLSSYFFAGLFSGIFIGIPLMFILYLKGHSES